VREARRLRRERGEHLDLQRRVRDVVLAAQHVGYAHLDIVDRARQHVQPRTVGAPHDRVAELRRLEMLRPADAVGPLDRSPWSSRKRQCGAIPSASLAARSASLSASAARS
jgi:hypothetical protein